MSRTFAFSAVVLRVVPFFLGMSCLSQTLNAQQTYTWQELRDKFETSNPTLRAGEIGVAESRAQQITAYLRPNPDFTLATDGTQLVPNQGAWHVFEGTQFLTSLSYLHERQGKRELRRDSAQKGTDVAISQLADQERTLLFTLRNGFVQTLQAKAILELSRENLAYYDQVLSVSRQRFTAGDIAKVDLDRLELQRVQYEQDVETSTVNLRTAKIQLHDFVPVHWTDIWRTT